MSLDWFLFALLLLIATLPLLRRLRSMPAWSAFLILATLALLGARFQEERIDRRRQADDQLHRITPSQGRPGGYAGSNACKACHPGYYESWHRTYHRTMTQYASPLSVKGEFNNVELTLNNERYSLSREGDEFWVDMPDPDFTYGRFLAAEAYESGQSTRPPPGGPPPRARKRIGLVTGSHHMQAYWVPSSAGNEQFTFPFTYLFEDQRWVPRNDIFLMPPDRPPLLQVWNGNCINCHATGGQPRRDAATSTFDTRVAEMGIACESCHGPAEEHIRIHRNPLERYTRQRSAEPDPTIVNPLLQTTRAASESCSQCHSIRYNDQADWNEEGFHYRPGGTFTPERPLPNHAKLALHHQLPASQREDLALWTNSFWNDGMVRVSGREFNGLASSPCHQRGNLSCLSCHSMHNSDPNDQLTAGMDGNQACLQCHQSLGTGLQAHTRHPPGSSGSLCYNCHMPHTSYGLLKAIRSHQIDSPTVQASLATGRPNACNLCHLDKSLAWTDAHLSSWTGSTRHSLTPDETDTSAALLWLLRGDAGQRALIHWHMGWGPAVEASGKDWLPPYLAEGLIDPYSAVRYLARRSLRSLPGFESFDFDYIAPPAAQAGARQRVLDLWKPNPGRATHTTLLLNPDGRPDRNRIELLLRQRDHRSMHLWE